MSIYNKILNLIKATLKGKTFYRILFNWEVAKRCVGLKGIGIDLASGKKGASYQRYWNVDFEKLIRVDLDKKNKPNVVADLNESLPFGDNSADNIFLFNAFYMIDKPNHFLREVNRTLKDGGKFFMTAQFIKSEEATTRDLYRYSSRKIEEMLREADFSKIQIYQVGRRFSAVGNLFDFSWGNFILFRIVKIFNRFLCLIFDKLSPKKLEKNYPCPISWFIVAEKHAQ